MHDTLGAFDISAVAICLVDEASHCLTKKGLAFSSKQATTPTVSFLSHILSSFVHQSGGVFTFGAGSCGQLGHDCLNDEVNPRRVLELMGSEVSQIACGR